MSEDPIPTDAEPSPPTSARTRVDSAIGWTVGHVVELTAIGVPVVVGTFTTVWLDLISVAVAGLWAVHQYRENRIRADITRRTLTAHADTVAAVRQLSTTGADATAPWRREGGQS